MNQNTKYKAIIQDMIREYQEYPNPRQSRLYHIIASYLDDETDEEVQNRFNEVAK